jgi:predicted anti-sigma-YlaC factor YlaD
MKHLSEEQLVTHYYGEDRQRAAVEEHLAACAVCRAVYEALERQLGGLELPVPERGEDYGQQVWQRIRPRLPAAARAVWPWQRWALAASMAVLVVGAFLAGRYWPGGGGSQPLAAPVRERVLLVTVGGHLERTEMVLVELLNARANGGVDISSEQQRAQDLLASSRLYRLAAARTGQAAVASILDELERVLLEVIHSPSPLAPEELGALRSRIENEDLLFRVRITGAGLRRAERNSQGSS